MTSRQLASSSNVSITLSTDLLATAAGGGNSATGEKISPSSSSADMPAVRRSTRDIKRKKFDDELIDTSIGKTPRRHRNSISELKPVTIILDEKPSSDIIMSASTPVSQVTLTNIKAAFTSGTDPATVTNAAILKTVPLSVSLSPPVPSTTQARPMPITPVGSIGNQQTSAAQATPQPAKKKSKGTKKSQGNAGPTNAQLQEQAAALKDVGRWQPTDDLALITAVMQTSDLSAVHTGVKFTCKFTLQEIAERWYALLYDPVISKLAQEAMKQLPPDVALSVQASTVFSKAEERILFTVLSSSTQSLEFFSELLNQHPDIFHPARTSRSLYQHWLHMRLHRLLPDQKPTPLPQGEYVMTFSDLEENFNDMEVPATDSITERELLLAERHLTKQIRHLENELPKWHVLVEYATGVASPDFDPSTVAVLRGRLVRYIMRSKEVTVGRNARGFQVDVDLSLEGPAFKVSRKQATIKLRSTGDFYMVNDGKRPMYVDGKPLLSGTKIKLNNNSIIEIACLRLLFLVNQDLINSMRTEATKMMVS